MSKESGLISLIFWRSLPAVIIGITLIFLSRSKKILQEFLKIKDRSCNFIFYSKNRTIYIPLGVIIKHVFQKALLNKLLISHTLYRVQTEFLSSPSAGKISATS